MKKCKCGKEYIQYNSMMTKCVECMLVAGKKLTIKKVKAFKDETYERKKALKSKHAWTKEAQIEFNRWVKFRDYNEVCISCGSNPNDEGITNGSRFDAGHYKSVGASKELRFEPLNCHKQCVKCNNYLSGNMVNYRINLIKKIGQKRVDWLEGPHEIPHRTIEDIKAIKVKYAKLARELKKELEL